MTKYEKWIQKYYPGAEHCKNRCAVAVNNMIFKFPELQIQVGRASGVYHCWCVTPDGVIIDPTAKQFKNPIKYVLIASRFLEKDEFEPATGAIFTDFTKDKT